MKTGLKFVFALAVIAACVSARAGEIIDRVVATVNGHPILLSDWDEALRYEALVNGRPLSSLTPADQKSTLDRLIDQELLREQMEGLTYPHATPEEVRHQILLIRKQLSAETDEAWRALLVRYGFTEEAFAARVESQLDTLRFLDLRLRPSVHIDPGSIEAYYREKLLPELRKSGAPEVALAEVSPKIEELLAQQRMDELLTDWLRNLRQQSQIRQTPALGPGGGGGPGAR